MSHERLNNLVPHISCFYELKVLIWLYASLRWNLRTQDSKPQLSICIQIFINLLCNKINGAKARTSLTPFFWKKKRERKEKRKKNALAEVANAKESQVVSLRQQPRFVLELLDVAYRKKMAPSTPSQEGMDFQSHRHHYEKRRPALPAPPPWCFWWASVRL